MNVMIVPKTTRDEALSSSLDAAMDSAYIDIAVGAVDWST